MASKPTKKAAPKRGATGRLKNPPRKTAPKRKAKPNAKSRRTRAARPHIHPIRRLWRWMRRVVFLAVAGLVLWIVAYAFLNPPTTPYIRAEAARLGGVDHQWVPLEEIAPVMARAVVAAEDANFCSHWGFDMNAIRAAIEGGGARGGSTISQQVVKNAFLWQGRSWLRKALEALITPAVEAVWTKRRIIEVYLNVAEFDQGIFGVEAAARHYFDTGPEALTPRQAALLAAVLPNPKGRSAAHPTSFLRNRASSIADGAATILADGRSACFED